MIKIELFTLYKLNDYFYLDVLTIETFDTISSLFSIGFDKGCFKWDFLFYKGIRSWWDSKRSLG